MINSNGEIISTSNAEIGMTNRGFLYGDAVFETLKVVKGRVLFWEDHYFRLMASMRIMRMEIPMNFTLEFLEAEIIKTIDANKFAHATVRVKLMVNRSGHGYYLPKDQAIDYMIQVELLEEANYIFLDNPYRVELYKDNYISPSILSTLKTNNKAINVLGSIYAHENSYDNCLLLNTNKQVVEALNANLFLVQGKTIKTPPLDDGCLKGIMRKQIMEIIAESEVYHLEEASISPFELQKADELFLTNVVMGIRSITSYRKKAFQTEVAQRLLQRLNEKIEN